jgi:conjugative relaxase-like TrwC/TraI family protein
MIDTNRTFKAFLAFTIGLTLAGAVGPIKGQDPGAQKMVATLAKLRPNNWRYYATYYQTGEAPGLWVGDGARELGLTGLVHHEQFENLYHGFSPDGMRPLVQNAGTDGFRPGFDLTLLPPKSVAIAWALGTPEVRHEIDLAIDAAMRFTLDELNARCGFTRRGKEGEEWERINLVISAWRHHTSRANDPLPHFHCLIHNVCRRHDGTTGTIDAREIFRHKMALGALFRCELAKELEERLGLVSVRKRAEDGRPLSWFELAGISEKAIYEFSKRGADIRRVLSETGYASAIAAERAALLTRAVKENVPLEVLLERWRQEGKRFGLDADRIQALCHKQKPRLDAEARLTAAVSRAVENLSRAQAHFAERDLLRAIAVEAQGEGLGGALVVAATTRGLSKCVRLGHWKAELRYATTETLKEEKKLLDAVRAATKEPSLTVTDRRLEKVIARNPGLSAEQKEALRQLTQASGRIQILQGLPGTGKTRVLRGVAQAYAKSGRVIGCALGGKAARGLEAETGIPSRTIHRTLRDLERGLPRRAAYHARHHARQLARAALGKRTYRMRERTKLTRRTVLVVDEAGMVGTPMYQRLLAAADRAKARVILAGDHRQLQPVDGSAPFGRMAKKLGAAQLTDIRRQRSPEDRQNVRSFAAGEARDALKDLVSRGKLTVAEDRGAAVEALIARWKEHGVKRPKENIMLTPTRAEAEALNRLAQAERARAGLLGRKSLAIGPEQVHRGDRVLCTRNSTLGVVNGDLGTVVALDLGRKALVVRLDTGVRVTLPVKRYGEHILLGYAATAHKLQGATVTRAYVLVGGTLQDRQMTTVQASRHCDDCEFFTDRLEAGDKLVDLARAMANDREKILAHDVMRPLRTQEPTL